MWVAISLHSFFWHVCLTMRMMLLLYQTYPLICVSTILISPAQDRSSHQHLLQCCEAALASGQCGRSATGSAQRASHVRHGGLLDHLGKMGLNAATALPLLFYNVWKMLSLLLFSSVPDGGQERRGPLHRRVQRQSHHALQHSHHGLGSWTVQVNQKM